MLNTLDVCAEGADVTATIVLGDGHPLLVDLMGPVLTEAGYRVVATACAPGVLVDEVRQHRPELCVVDHVSLTGSPAGGPQARALLEDLVRAGRPDAHVVVITADPDPAGLASARSVGVGCYLDKDRPLARLLDVLRAVRAGELVVDTRAQRLAERPARRPLRRGDRTGVHGRAEALTARERECLTLLVEGSNTARMVEELGISAATVRSHVQAILHKLGVHSRLEAASLAVRHDLLSTDNAQAG